MSRKITILIIISVLGLIALSTIQAYLINNTYKLKKNSFLKETKKVISRIDDLSPELDSINDVWQDYFLSVVSEYKLKKIKKEDVLRLFRQKLDTINKAYKDVYKQELQIKKIPFHLQFQKRVKTIIVRDSVLNDTLFVSTGKIPKFHLLGDSFTEEESYKTSNSLWQTEHFFNVIENGNEMEISFNLYFETEEFININGWKRIVFNQMKGLLIASFLIFLVVFGLLYYSIKNLITQKKIAAIKTDFVNNITHELKTPLATLSIATKILANEKIKKQPEILNNTINTIERQNKRLQKLIDQVLTNSLGYNEIKLTKEKINPQVYFNTVLDDFLLSVKEKTINLIREIPVLNHEVFIDKFYLTTALFNILENAVKYNDGAVMLNFSIVIKEQLIISISDNGIGISEQQQQLLFDKFYRVNTQELHNVSGLGLGLYYSQQIIKAHQGEIIVKSSTKEGTTFTIKIPMNRR